MDRRISAVDAVVGFLFGTLGRRFLGKLFHADEDCDACGLCLKLCPSGTIVLKEGSPFRPYWKSSCENCNACINACPKKAIVTSTGRLAVILAAVTAFAVLGIWAYSAFVTSLLRGTVLPGVRLLIDITAVTAVIILAHVVGIGPVDRFVLRYLERMPGVSGFFAWTFMKRWRRYAADKLDG